MQSFFTVLDISHGASFCGVANNDDKAEAFQLSAGKHQQSTDLAEVQLALVSEEGDAGPGSWQSLYCLARGRLVPHNFDKRGPLL